ncbi:histidine kinase [Geoanaerobacter pelophilus]|uniref:histidine kinase n=1 Tax=Geoanaerobacter pelophilus TaxID=60036 RepID=A0ABQ0MGZ2_9BACT|nr:ATP-binding protein [Geoanaerobacter pelophilus]GAW66368.1 histidine kinase [Geoanaerobacter pelophilus]
MTSRLEVKIIVYLALILTLLIAVYGWWIGKRQTSVYIQTLSDNLRILSRSDADNAAHYMVIQEYAGLEANMLDSANLPEVVSIQVAELDGHLLCNIERPNRSERPKLNYKVKTITVPQGSLPILKREGNQLVSWAPILAGEQLGWVKVSLSLDTAQRLVQATWRSTLAIGALWIMVGTILMALVVRPPLKAVRELSRFAHELQNRKGGQVSVPRGVFEIDMLADALNHSSGELLRAEQRLIAEQERLSVTLQSIGDGVIATDIESRIVLVNHVAELMTGWTESEAAGVSLDQVLCIEANDPLRDVREPLQAVLEQRRTVELPGQHHVWSRDGVCRTVTVIGAPIIDSAGTLAGMVLVIRDLTEKARMEAEKARLAEQLLQSQKMEAVGQLAGGVAHDFNNMLGVIIGNAELAMMGVEPTGKLHERLQGIQDAANRSADITRQLLAFSRQQHAEPKVLDLNEVIGNMLKMLHRLIGEDIDLAWSPGRDIWKVKLDPTQLDQIMANLCVNARDAIAGVGKLEIRTRNVNLSPEEGKRPVEMPPGEWVMLEVSDSGCGMRREVLERIFEPFYTTKEVGRGTGLGLATVFGIVKQNYGYIEVQSEPGVGTSFRIYFPAAQEEAQEVKRRQVAAIRGNETILLVEDEPSINALATTMLSELGYRVLAAGSPEEAVKVANGGKMKIDLLLTDIIMPGMNGRDLSELLHQSHPDMKCLFMSGYTSDIISQRGNIGQEVCFVQKPFTTQALAAKVREALQA